VQKNQQLILENQIQLIDSNLSLLDNLIYSMATNSDLITVLSRKESQKSAFDSSVQNFYNVLNFQMSSIKKYISIIHIQGYNGFSVRKGFEAYLINLEDYKDTAWYTESLKSTGEILWWGMQKNYTRIPHVEIAAPSDYIVPIFKKICRPDDLSAVGDMVIFVSPNLFLGEEYEYQSDRDSTSYLVDEKRDIIYTSSREILEDESHANLSDMVDFEISNATASKVYMNYEGNKLIMCKKSAQADLYLVRIIELDNVLAEESSFKYITIFFIVFLVIISLILSIWFAGYFSKPIEQIILKINKIAEGDFQYELSMKQGVKKFEALYHNLHKMELNIQEMMNENTRKEKEKRTLEIQMLQMQINPHFLFNTLNSIKWMANLQRAYGIESMVTSLGMVLEASYNKTDEFVTVKEELEVLQYYFNIQKIRYQDKISLDMLCGREDLLECLIPRFILQPIVENSIFHGIAPKETRGIIRITVEDFEDDLLIIIRDNGIGLDRDKLDGILKEPPDALSHRGLKGIGLSNVHSRIQLTYGLNYGLAVESVKEEYTQVTAKIPKQYREAGNNESISG
jgi:sensor histidine kinase YesM